MKRKDNHNEEIKATRVGGFGGSDARMLLDIHERIASGSDLTTAQKHRLRVAKGLEPYRPVKETPDIMAGRAFEDEVAAKMPRNWDRETFMTSPEVSPVNFRAFAHADFCDLGIMAVKEVKWSRVLNRDGLLARYAAQLQWYYLLGAHSVSMVYSAADGRGCADVPRDESMIKELRQAVRTLDEQWDTLNLNIAEFGEEDTAPSVLEAIKRLREATKAKEAAEAEIARLKEELAAAFRVNKAVKFYGDYGSITYTPPTSIVTFDTKKFAKELPILYATYRTKIVTKGEVITCRFSDYTQFKIQSNDKKRIWR